MVGFRHLLRMLEAAALHPHATADAVSVLRSRVGLGITATPGEPGAAGTAAKVAEEAAPGSTGIVGDFEPAAAAETAARLSYVKSGLSLLALEKGAQLLQVRPLLLFP